MTRDMLRVVSLVLGLCAFFAGNFAYAQSDPANADFISGYGLRNLPNAVLIHASPANPSAGDTVHFTVEGSVYDLPKDTITWRVNGKTLASNVGATSVDAIVDAKGSPLNVTVTVSDALWGIASNALTIVPLQVDILYDAPTYVPPFYRGRALPSAGGAMHLQAEARLIKNGAQLPASAITYTWSRNGTVLGNVSGAGKSRIAIDAPNMYGSDTITVRANNADETLSASASVVIPNAQTALMLYEDQPLYGVMYFNALPEMISAPHDMTVAAVPYFATITGLNDPALKYTWLLDDAPISASSTRRNEVTIDSGKNSAHLHLDIASSRNFFLDASSDWKFQFGNSGGSTITKPGSSDVFHKSSI